MPDSQKGGPSPSEFLTDQSPYLNNQMPSHLECAHGTHPAICKLCEETQADLQNALTNRENPLFNVLERLKTNPDFLEEICNSGNLDDLERVFNLSNEISQIIVQILYNQEYYSQISTTNYLALLQKILLLIRENKLPLETETVEQYTVYRIQEILKLEEVTQNKLVEAIHQAGSLNGLCSSDISEQVIGGLSQRASELGISSAEYIGCLNNLLEISASHQNIRRDIFARIPLILLQTKWREIRDFFAEHLPAYLETPITCLGKIDDTPEFQSLDTNTKKKFYGLMREMSQPLLQAGYYMFNHENGNLEETKAVFKLLEDVVEYKEFKEIEKINAKNNRIAAILNHQEALGEQQTFAELQGLFAESAREILDACNALFTDDIPSERFQDTLPKKLTYIKETILDKVYQNSKYPEFKHLILPITAFLNMSAVVAKQVDFLQTPSDLVSDFETNPHSYESLRQKEYAYLEELLNNSSGNPDFLKFRKEFASYYCDLLALAVKTEPQDVNSSSVREIDTICRVCGIHYPQRMLNQFMEMSEKISSNVEKTSQVIGLTHDVITSGGELAVHDLKNFIADRSIDSKLKYQALTQINDFLSPIFASFIESHDREWNAVHNTDVGLATRSYAQDIAAMLNPNIETSLPHEYDGATLLNTLADRMNCSAEELRHALEQNFSEGVNETDLESWQCAASLHDIGKVGVMPHIFYLPRGLSKQQFAEMQTHTTHSYEILKDYPDPNVPAVALCHHEKWDGSGYPNGLKGEEIPLPARIVAISDVYIAITENRIYKKDYKDKTTKQIFVEAIVVFLEDYFDSKKHAFCPFLLQLQLARFGINTKDFEHLYQGWNNTDKTEVEKLIPWDLPRLQKELVRIDLAKQREFSAKEKLQSKIADMHDHVDSMGMKVNHIVDFKELWYIPERVKEQRCEFEEEGKDLSNLSFSDQKLLNLTDKEAAQGKKNVENSIHTLNTLKLGPDALKTQSKLSLNAETLQVMERIKLNQYKINMLASQTNRLDYSLQALLKYIKNIPESFNFSSQFVTDDNAPAD